MLCNKCLHCAVLTDLYAVLTNLCAAAAIRRVYRGRI